MLIISCEGCVYNDGNPKAECVLCKTGDSFTPKETQSTPTTDNINPSHYRQGKVECIDAIESATTSLNGFEGYCTGNAIKYLWRWKQKNGIEDLRKAKWYLEKLIETEEANE